MMRLHSVLLSLIVLSFTPHGVASECRSVNLAKELDAAISNKDLQEVEKLVAAGANVNGAVSAMPHLCAAATLGNVAIVKFLVETCKVEMEVKDSMGATPLYAVTELLRYGNVHLENFSNKLGESFGFTPEKTKLSGDDGIEQDRRRREVVKFLVQNNANLEAKNHFGDTPLYRLRVNGNEDLAKKSAQGATNDKVVACCNVCSKSTDLKKCARCKKAHYCSRECQKKDWPAHKYTCNNIHRSTLTDKKNDADG